jgi:hypothetical protein
VPDKENGEPGAPLNVTCSDSGACDDKTGRCTCHDRSTGFFCTVYPGIDQYQWVMIVIIVGSVVLLGATFYLLKLRKDRLNREEAEAKEKILQAAVGAAPAAGGASSLL